MISDLRYLGKIGSENSFYWSSKRGEQIFDYENNEYRLFQCKVTPSPSPSMPSVQVLVLNNLGWPGLSMFVIRNQSLKDNTISWYNFDNVKLHQGPDGFFTFKYSEYTGIPGISKNSKSADPIHLLPPRTQRELNLLFLPTLREEKLTDLGI